MSTSKITLYKSAITPSRNFRVDDIDSYLNTCSKIEFNKLQYQKLDLNMYIKLPLAQELISNPQYNYARLEQDNKEFYFFIMSADWIAKRTIGFSLSMDTINTYWSAVKWNKSTQIIREHRDRYAASPNNYHKRIIDKYDEGMNPLKDNIFTTRELSTPEYHEGFLVWIANKEVNLDNQSATPIIPCYCRRKSFTFAEEQDYGSTDVSLSLDTNKVYFLTTSAIGNDAYFYTDVSTNQYKLPINHSDSSVSRCYVLMRTGAALYTIKELKYTGDVYPYIWKATDTFTLQGTPNKIIFHNVDYITYASNTEFYKNLTSLDTIDSLDRLAVHSGKIPAKICTSFADLDRSNTNIVKILKIPFELRDNWRGDTFIPGWNLVRINHPNAYLPIELDNNSCDTEHYIYSDMRKFLYTTINPRAKDTFNYERESKLYSSEFFDFKVAYMNEAYPLQLEKVKECSSNFRDIYVDISSSISSSARINFRFGSDYEWSTFNQNYWSIPLIEIPQYNSQWIDYLRNGYNYDEYTRKESNKKAIISGVISAVGAVSSMIPNVSSFTSQYKDYKKTLEWKSKNKFLFDLFDDYDFINSGDITKDWDSYKYPGDTATLAQNYEISNAQKNKAYQLYQNPPKLSKQFYGIGNLVLQNGINALNSAVSSIMNINSTNTSFARNVASMNYSGISVQDSSAFDIANTTPTLVEAYPREEIRKQIAAVFHYTGYSHPVQDIPDFTSRYWFNFVQCNPVFDEALNILHPEFEDDFKKRFRAGITVMHNHNGEYDWNQQYENWEENLINE